MNCDVIKNYPGQIIYSSDNNNNFNNNSTKTSILTNEKIQEVFNKCFIDEFKNFNASNDQVGGLIKNCEFKFVRPTKMESENKVSYVTNFVLNINKDDYKNKAVKDEFDKEIGFFNFKITEYLNSSKENKPFSISYFSEIQFSEQFKGCKLFNVIFNTYTKTLQALETDVDYLHVKSHETFTASLYQRKGYNFTQNSKDSIERDFGVEEYLKNSSVSFDESYEVEMYRSFSPEKMTIPTSIKDLEQNVSSK